MAKQRKQQSDPDRSAERQMRNQEVLRANRELAAYFKGRRTEREARAALKTIKAFVRDREGLSAKHRSPLPGVTDARPTNDGAGPAASADVKRTKQKAHRARKDTPQVNPGLPPPASDESHDES